MNTIITTNTTKLYVASRSEDVNLKDIPFMFQILGTGEVFLKTINQIEEYLTKMSEFFDGHWYYTNAGQVLRDVVAGNLPTEELAITLLNESSCFHVGDKLEFNTPQNINVYAYKKMVFQSAVLRVFASYIAMMYANKTTVAYNGLDPYGGFILRVQK